MPGEMGRGVNAAVLLDANVLLLLLVGSLDVGLIRRFKRTASFEVDDYRLLVEVVGRFSRVVTTPHVLTEVSNLAEGLTGPQGESFCSRLAAFLGEAEERYVSAESLSSTAVFCRLGLSDAGVAEIASSQNLEVVTLDLELWVALVAANVTAHNFNHVRAAGRFE